MKSVKFESTYSKSALGVPNTQSENETITVLPTKDNLFFYNFFSDHKYNGSDCAILNWFYLTFCGEYTTFHINL